VTAHPTPQPLHELTGTGAHRGLRSLVVQQESYGRGVAARVLPAVIVAAVVALLLWWVEGAQAAVITGLVALAASALIPDRSHR
jgi:hypothetical protein